LKFVDIIVKVIEKNTGWMECYIVPSEELRKEVVKICLPIFFLFSKGEVCMLQKKEEYDVGDVDWARWNNHKILFVNNQFLFRYFI
jgi:hypothetical protein